MKKTYKTDYILKHFSPGELQKAAGVPAFVTAKLKRGEISLTGKTSAKLKYFYNRSMKEKLVKSGIRKDKSAFLVKNFSVNKMEKEKRLHRKVAKTILRNKKKEYPETTLEDILNGMSRSFREDIGDWIVYIKEKKYK